ncbi:hypothetical protein TRM7557_02942 [Tritonibacter multivorans]|uniref:YHYH domain-containing protein n=1 Tax=Tritonibacter multivorans TaxID=928856 RepID=A0A0P1GG31_9RHOB|nr:YHYH protein [Tritonibacter multivorans]MDA7420919.1 YHYH protein [Tritonibacter multivorans]CUH80527.1 hypothetical protein TRM7557_02942 [Tritonibacter multivorans]SFC81985.1 YHYH protein [Tritonibacter multivorans]
MSNRHARRARSCFLPAILAPALVACAAAGPSTSGSQQRHNHTHGTLGEGHTHDITDRILTNRSGDCADYAAAYTAAPRDVQRRRDHTAAVQVTVKGAQCQITSNAMPNHDFNTAGARFVTPVQETQTTLSVPRNPQPAARTTALSQRSYDAVLLNGVVVDLLSAGCYRPDARRADRNGNVHIGCSTRDMWLLDPLGPGTSFGTDAHNAHTQPDGRYHYHGNPMALFDDQPSPEGSPVIGFAADGFPIFGSYFVDGSGTLRKARSGYSLRSGSRPDGADSPGGRYDGTYVDDYQFTGTGDLDECNGMTVDGQYGYYVTDSYPWMMNCFAGNPDGSFDKGRPGGRARPAHGHPPHAGRPHRG